MDERSVAIKLAMLLPLLDLCLRTVGFQRTWAYLGRRLPETPLRSEVGSSLPSPGRIADLARAVGAHSPWRTTCLRQSLAVWWLLRRRGLAAELKIGIDRKGPPLQAHAWVELSGQALDPDAGRYTAFPRVPSNLTSMP